MLSLYGLFLRAESAKPDREALLAIFEATSGPEWKTQKGWDDIDIRDWYGVTVDMKGRVMELKLPDNGLSGAYTLTQNAEAFWLFHQLALRLLVARTSSCSKCLALAGRQLDGEIEEREQTCTSWSS